ncbi:MAG TPA: HAD domain-containing protein [Aldersonia sp.]
MKVLFLDIDGVVNKVGTHARYRDSVAIDPFLAFRIGKIVVETGCQVVLSSTWRLFPDLRRAVEEYVTDILDVTPIVAGDFRGDEVRAWLAGHPEVSRYAILDDGNDFHDDQPLFQTTWLTGITDEIAQRVIEYLNADECPRSDSNRH